MVAFGDPVSALDAPSGSPYVGDMRNRNHALIASLQEAAGTIGQNARLLEVAAVISEAVAPTRVVVVGGLAVSYWTAIEATDIDLLMPQTLEIAGRLQDLGLVRHTGERHWYLPGTQIAIEAPAAALAPEDIALPVESPSGRPLEILSPADCVAWRLQEFVGAPHPDVARQMILLRASTLFDEAQLNASAAAKGLAPALSFLAELTDAPPEHFDSLDLRAIAGKMERACYDRRRD